MRTVWMPGGLRLDVHLTAADTAGALTLIVDEPPVGWSLPRHRHQREAETIHVLAGRFAMHVDGTLHQLGPGDTIHVPAGAEHDGALVGDEPGRRVITFTPGGMDEFFVAAGSDSPSAEIDTRRVVELALAHGWQFDQTTR